MERGSAMSILAHQSRAPDKPVAKDNMQTLPLAEVEKELGSSPDGLTEAEAQKRLAQYGPNEIAEKKTNEILKFLSYFWGPIPWMIEAAVILSAVARHWPDFGIILLLLLANGAVGFWEEHQAGNAIAALKATLAIKARVKRDGKWVNPAARELVPGDAIRLRLGDIVPADARLLDGDEISVDQSALTGEVLACHAQIGRRRLLRIDRSSRRNRRAGLCDGRQNLLRQDGGTGGDGGHRQPFPEGRTEDRQLPDRPRADPRGGHHRTWNLPRRADPDPVAVRPRADGRGDPRRHADGSLGDDGGRRAPAREETGDREQAGRDRGTGGRGCPVRRQDRDPDPEQTDARRSVLPGCDHRRRTHPRRRAGLASGEQRHDRSRGPRRPEGQGGAEALSGHTFHAVRSRAQADRGHGQGRGRKNVQGDQRRATGHSGAVGERGRGEVRRRQGGQRLRRARLSCARRGAWRKATANGGFSASCRCSIRRA